MKRLGHTLRSLRRRIGDGPDAGDGETQGDATAVAGQRPPSAQQPPQMAWTLADLVQDTDADDDPARDALLTAQEERIAQLTDVFTPSRPKFGGHNFSGRRPTRERLRQILFQQGAHVLLYGSRGLGKTSLANAIAQIGDECGFIVARLSCSHTTTFQDLTRGLMRRLVQAEVLEFDQAAPDATAHGLMDLLAGAHRHPILFVLDDLDNVEDPSFRQMLLETLKGVSDLGLPARFLIVGVARDIETIVGRDVRLERNLVAVQLPHMSWTDLQTLIDGGMAACGLHCPAEIGDTIRIVSRSLPFVAQSLCLNAALRAVNHGRGRLDPADLIHAIDRFLDEIDPRIRDTYDIVTRQENHLLMVDLMFCLAVARQDRYGQISVDDMAEVPVASSGRRLDRATIQRGVDVLVAENAVLEPRLDSRGSPRYAFATDLLRPFTLMRQGRAKGLLPAAAEDAASF